MFSSHIVVTRKVSLGKLIFLKQYAEDSDGIDDEAQQKLWDVTNATYFFHLREEARNGPLRREVHNVSSTSEKRKNSGLYFSPVDYRR